MYWGHQTPKPYSRQSKIYYVTLNPLFSKRVWIIPLAGKSWCMAGISGPTVDLVAGEKSGMTWPELQMCGNDKIGIGNRIVLDKFKKEEVNLSVRASGRGQRLVPLGAYLTPQPTFCFRIHNIPVFESFILDYVQLLIMGQEQEYSADCSACRVL